MAVGVTSSSCSPLSFCCNNRAARGPRAQPKADDSTEFHGKAKWGYLLQFKSWPSRGSAICACSAISPYALEPSEINCVPLRTYRLEICSKSNCFPGVCLWSRGCAEERLHSAVQHSPAQTDLKRSRQTDQSSNGRNFSGKQHSKPQNSHNNAHQ